MNNNTSEARALNADNNNHVEATVLRLVEELIQDWGLELEGPIVGETRLAKDLDFVSVDFIQLLVAVEQHYGRKLGFQDLVMRDGSYVPDLQISQVIDFVGNALKREG